MSRAVLVGSMLGWLAVPMGAQGPATQPTVPAQPKITGTVFYRERIALPQDASVRVRLEDASRPEMTPKLVAEAVISTEGKQVPIPFELAYKADDIRPANRYVVRATITADGKTLFASKNPYPVITRGAPTKVEILVQAAGSRPSRLQPSPPEAATLEGATWRLVELGGASIVAEKGESRLELDAESKRLSGSTGCNRFMGTYDLTASGLRLAPAGMTMMACSEASMKQEAAFLEALRATTGYRISGEKLELLDADHVLAAFTPRAPE